MKNGLIKSIKKGATRVILGMLVLLFSFFLYGQYIFVGMDFSRTSLEISKTQAAGLEDLVSGDIVEEREDGAVELQKDVIVYTDDVEAELADGTVIESKTGDEVVLEEFSARAVSESEVKEKLAGDEEAVSKVHAVAEFGIPGEHLVFSKPVKMIIPMDMPDGKTFEIKVQHEGEGVSTKGITQNPDATCNADGTSSDEDNTVTVRDGAVEFYTCGASLFIVDNNTNNVTVSNVAGSCSGADYVYTVYWHADNNETSVDLVNVGDGSTIAGGQTSSPITVTLAGNTNTTAFDVKVVETGNTGNESNTATVSPLNCGNASNDFIFKVKTDNVGTSTDTQFTVPTDPNSTYLYHIDCDNDGMFDGAGISGDFTCDYPSAGTYTVRIQDAVGDGTGFPRIIFGRDSNAPTNVQTDSQKLVNILQWGNIKWTSFDSAFEYATNLNSISASDIPDLSGVTNLYEMFRGTAFASIPNLNNWDVSNITNMGGMFDANANFNQDLNNWDVSNVTSFYAMFRGASSFNGDITSWDMGSATTLNRMFEGATSFNRDIGIWNVSNVTDLGYTFRQADNFNQDISGWDTSSVTSLRQTFEGADLFNQPLDNWDVSNVISMYQTFNAAKAFNQPLNNWNTSNVRSMTRMFREASAFNQPLDNWDVSSVGLLVGGNPGTMRSMFEGATAFDQNLGNWNPEKLTDATYMFRNAGLSTANYDALLTGWASKTLQNGVTFDAGNSVYCQAAAARQSIIDTYGWTINDAGMCTVTAPGGVSSNLMLWLKADAGVTGTTAISEWRDQSMMNNHVTQSDSAKQPALVENAINFNPLLKFDNDLLTSTSSNLSTGTPAREVFVLSKQDSVDNFGAFLYIGNTTIASDGKNIAFGMFNPADTAVTDALALYTSGATNNATEWYANANPYTKTKPIISHYAAAAGASLSSYQLFANAKALPTPLLKNNTSDLDITPNIIDQEFHIGAKQSNLSGISNAFLQGGLGEVIVYDTNLSNTQRQQINSYIAIKYGITLDQTTPYDYLASDGTTKIWDSSVDTAFNNDIFGIGRDDDSTLDQRVSKSVNNDALVTIATDNDFTSPNGGSRTQLDNLEFLTVANNNGDTSAWTTSGAPTGRQILGRVWKVQETGTVGTVYISVPDAASSESAKLPQAYAGKAYLLTDADGDFSSGATETEMTLNGNRWELPAGIDLSDGEYFTFATDGGFTVEIEATDNEAQENVDDGEFTFTLSGALPVDLTVNYTVSGSATGGDDYTAFSGSVTIPAGSTSATVTVDASQFNDSNIEGDETVTLTLTGTDNGAVTLGTNTEASVTIKDDETDPTQGGTAVELSVTASDADAAENPADNGAFTFSINNTLSEDLIINYTVSGGATPGSDYVALSGTTTIPAGSTSVVVDVDTNGFDDTLVEADEYVIVTLADTDNFGVANASAPNNSATVTIADDDTAEVSVTASAQADEGTETNGAFTISLSAESATDTIVQYSVSGTATSAGADADYAALSGSVTIPAGSTSAIVTVDVSGKDDNRFEGDETVVLTITGTDNTNITVAASPQDTATVTITDDEPQNVTADLSVTTHGDENGPQAMVFTVTLSQINNTGAPIVFDSAFTGGSATVGDDYTDVSGAATLSVPDGNAVGTLAVPVIDDTLWDDTETVTMTISNPSSAWVTISGASATATIADNDAALTMDTVHIQSDNTDPTQAKEGDTITLTVTFSDAVQNVSATIAGVNATTVTNTGGNTWEISIPALDGSEPEGLATFTVTAESLGGGALSPISSTTDDSSVTIDFTSPQEPQVIAPVPGGKITVPTPTTGQCDEESVRVEFTTTPAGGLDPEPQTLPLDAQGNFNGLLTWNSSIQGDYTLVVSCIDKAGNKTSKTVGPLIPITDPTAKKISLDGGNVFVEAAANDGTIGNDIFVTIQNTRFAHRGGVLQEGQDFTVTGVPNGYTLRIAISADGTRAVLMLDGTAVAHENADDVRDLKLTFTDSAFDGDSQADILNNTLVLGVDYFDANSGGGGGGGASSGALQYSGFFKEDTDNTGTMRTSRLGSEIMITLGGGARFAGSVAVGNGVTVQNVPNGLTPTITRVDDTHLRLTLGGSAIQHDPDDTVRILTIVIDDAAFDGATAAAVANAIYGFGEVRFIDSDDDDGDGVSNTDEDSAHNGGDGNGDGIEDRKQQNVASTSNPVTGGTFTIEALNGPCDIVSDVQGYAESVLAVQDADGDYPVGLFGFTVECSDAGGSEEMRILLDRVYDDAATWTVRKFYPSTGVYVSLTPQPTISTLTLQNGPASGTEVTTITFTVTDGDGQTDTDTIRDRFITDPNGPALPIISWESVTSRGGEGETVTLTITSTLPLPTDVTIPLTVGGTANGDDYTPALPTTITIPAGEMDAQLSFQLTKDGPDEDDETLTITIGDGSGYSVSDQRIHTLTITDNPDDAINLREPRDVDVTCSKKGYAKITWDDRAQGEDGFKIQRRILFPDGRKGAWIKVKTISDDNEESYKDRGPFVAGVTYQWRVRAYRDDERGEWSKKVECSFTESGGGGGTVTPAPTPGPTTPDPTNPGPTTPDPTNPDPTSSKTTQPSSASTQDDTATSASSASQSDTSSMHCGSYWLLWLIGLIVAVVLLTLFPQLVPIVIISIIAVLAWLFLDTCRSYWWMPLLTVLYAGVLFVRGNDKEDDRYRAEE